jgi:hypothetical protein
MWLVLTAETCVEVAPQWLYMTAEGTAGGDCEMSGVLKAVSGDIDGRAWVLLPVDEKGIGDGINMRVDAFTPGHMCCEMD